MLYQRGKTWYIGYSDGRHWIREAVGESKKLAEAVLGKRKSEVREGKFLDIRKNEKIKFEDFAKTYVELHSKVNKRPRVAKRDEQLINHLSEYFSGKYLYEITPKQIEEYKKIRKETKKKNGKEIAAATVNRELACLKSMFNKAVAWGKATDNPVRKVKLFKENNTRIRYLEKEQIRPFLDACVPHLKPIVIVALFTGMRKSEIFELKWQNIHFEREIIYILQTKSGERQQVPMSDIVKKTLIGVPKRPDSAYVFCNKDGRPYTNVRKSFDAALKKCDIIDFHFHDLRHTFASQLVMAGVDIKTVQELMRHKSIEMTMRYAHLSPDHKKKAVDILGQKISTIIAQTPVTEEAGTIEELPNSLKQAELVSPRWRSSVGRAAVS